jgi:two-component system, LytTR family, sensor histidine kinase LytS
VPSPMHEIVGLSLDLLERLSILAVLFFILMRFELFRRLLTGRATGREKLFHAAYFGCAGIFATYCGFPVQGAIANLRTVPVVIGGILGGPLVGLSAGLIAGLHRYFYDLGGVTSLSCGIATPLAGVVAGLLYRRVQRRPFDWLAALFIGVVAESIKMGLILLLARPHQLGLFVVQSIGVPSVLANAFGVAVLVELIAAVARDQDRAGAQQAQTTLGIALRTLPYLRHGLNRESAAAAARIIREMTGLDAVAFCSAGELLAHEGVDGARHAPGERDLPQAALRAFETGALVVAMTREEIGYPDPGGKLGSASIVPLKKGDKVVGVMALYRSKEQTMSRLDEELAHGLSHLFSNQLALGELELQRKLVAEAEIKALQAQINPHFLFNAISTIISYTRTDPKTASGLLVKLAEFFRKNISPTASEVPLSVELEHCEAYLAIEKARFEERLSIVYQIDKGALSCLVPSLILQPLVENGVRHGILPREGGGMIHISARREGTDLAICIKDNGVGMSQERLRSLLRETDRLPESATGTGSGSAKGTGAKVGMGAATGVGTGVGVELASGTGLGIALKNVNGRLTTMYGKDRSLSIESEPGVGTTVRFCIPVST